MQASAVHCSCGAAQGRTHRDDADPGTEPGVCRFSQQCQSFHRYAKAGFDQRRQPALRNVKLIRRSPIRG